MFSCEVRQYDSTRRLRLIRSQPWTNAIREMETPTFLYGKRQSCEPQERSKDKATMRSRIDKRVTSGEGTPLWEISGFFSSPLQGLRAEYSYAVPFFWLFRSLGASSVSKLRCHWLDGGRCTSRYLLVRLYLLPAVLCSFSSSTHPHPVFISNWQRGCGTSG